MKFSIFSQNCLYPLQKLSLHIIINYNYNPFKTLTRLIIIRIGRFPVQTLLGAWSGLEIQPRYKAPGDPWILKL